MQETSLLSFTETFTGIFIGIKKYFMPTHIRKAHKRILRKKKGSSFSKVTIRVRKTKVKRK